MGIQNKVYLAGPIANLTFSQAQEWRTYLMTAVRSKHIHCFSPLRGKEFLDNGESINGTYNHPLATRHGIRGRDAFDVRTCDVLVANLTDVKTISGGTAWELGIAHALNIPVVYIVGAFEDENENPYLLHPILGDVPAFVVHSLDEAADILKSILLEDPGELLTLS